MTEVQLWGGDANWWQAHVPLRHHVKMENGEDAAQHNLHDSHQGLPWSCTECANPTSPDCSHTLQKKVHLLEAELKAIRCERAAGWSAAVDALKAFTAERHAWVRPGKSLFCAHSPIFRPFPGR